MKATTSVVRAVELPTELPKFGIKRRESPAGILIERGPRPNPLKWAGTLIQNWEILIYDRDDHWEACFFKWGEHHEHLSASSFDDARVQATARIHALEYGTRPRRAAAIPIPGSRRSHLAVARRS